MQTITRSFILILWMQILTSVRSEDCTLQQFMNGQMYDSNFDISDLEASYPVGQQLKVNCKIGYSGFFKLICTNIGWKHIGKKCEPKPCGHPGEAAFADFALESADDFVFGSKVVYTCHNGYQMISRINYRNCLAGGWDGVVPTCEAIQCPEVHVENNVQIIGQSNEATYGNVVRFVCKFNYEVLLGSPETYCNEKGEWTSLPPKCEEIKCLKPAVENGIVISNTKVYKENEFLNFECNPGFKHTDNMLSKCIKVGVRAEWTPAPRCEQITCKLSLPPVSGTSYRPNHISTFPPGETMTVTCGDRYWIVDHLTTSVTTKCKNDGEWSIRPTCREVICRIEHGQRTHTWDSWWKNAIKLDETLGYQCNEGYKKPDGFNRARCTREGLKPNPLCQEIQCTRKYIPNTELLNEKDKYRFKETAYYKCTDGYKGQFSLYCGRHGEWSGNSECDEVTCGIEHGQHTHTWDSWWKSTIKLDETLGYQCNKGYKKPDGYDRARCTREGLKPNPLCQAQCTKLKINKAHITRNDKESYIHNDRVEFMCDNKDGQAFEVVCENGIWTGIQNCSGCIVPKITNGFAKSTLNEMYYTCNEGFKLITEGWWAQSKCDEGQWLGLGSCIDESHCGPVPPIPNGEVTSPQPSYENNAQVPIECKKGYETKIPHLTCKKGVWQPNDTALNSICTYAAKPCSAPAKVDNAVILTEFQNIYLSGSEVIYVCRRDYTGQKTEIRCTEGKWEKTTLNCTAPSTEHRNGNSSSLKEFSSVINE